MFHSWIIEYIIVTLKIYFYQRKLSFSLRFGIVDAVSFSAHNLGVFCFNYGCQLYFCFNYIFSFVSTIFMFCFNYIFVSTIFLFQLYFGFNYILVSTIFWFQLYFGFNYIFVSTIFWFQLYFCFNYIFVLFQLYFCFNYGCCIRENLPCIYCDWRVTLHWVTFNLPYQNWRAWVSGPC